MMPRRPLSGPASFVVWLVPSVGVVGMLALAVLAPRDLDPVLYVSLIAWIASFGFVGAFLSMRLPWNPIGWLLWLSAAVVSVAFCGSDYAGYSLERAAGTFPATVPIAWLSSWTFIPAIALTLIYIPLLFPDGRLPSRRWLPVAVFGALATAGASLAAFGPVLSNVDNLPNPVFIPQLAPLIAIAGFPPGQFMGATILVSLTAPIARYRHGDAIERRQLKWFAFVLVIVFLVFAFGPDLVSFISLALLPIGIGIAILRFRLYEIDRIISRTVSYAVLTGILAGAFLGGTVLIQAAIARDLPGDTVAVAGSTMAVALLFQPLRRRIQDATDRRFNRSRYDAEQTVAALARRLRVQADLRDLTRDILTTTIDSVQPTTAGLWLREGTGARRAPGHGAERAPSDGTRRR